MTLPTADFPLAVNDGNEQDIAHDGPAATDRAQAGDYNEHSSEVIALENWTRPKKSIVGVNRTGNTLAAGKLVAILPTGPDAVTDLPSLILANCSLIYGQAVGILPAAVLNDANGEVLLGGIYGPLNTIAWDSVGDPVFLTTAGQLSCYPLATPSYGIQCIGRIAQRHASLGYIWLDPDAGFRVRSVACARIGGLAGSDDRYLLATPGDCYALRLLLVSDTTTGGSNAGNNWTLQVRNLSDAVDLMSAVFSTFGSELSANVAKIIAFNQNQRIALAQRVLELQIVKTGSPTDLTSAEISAFLEFVGMGR